MIVTAMNTNSTFDSHLRRSHPTHSNTDKLTMQPDSNYSNSSPASVAPVGYTSVVAAGSLVAGSLVAGILDIPVGIPVEDIAADTADIAWVVAAGSCYCTRIAALVLGMIVQVV